MTIDSKKMAAISSAVFTYIKTCEEAAYFASGAGAGKAKVIEPPVTGTGNYPNMWGSMGRSDIMQMRTMMQMRTFR
ncbi:hypothetical protein [Desulfamplus magnetovallimortis]|nr:hypothetical protein [Desulfamplus magnetovallimortis]